MSYVLLYPDGGYVAIDPHSGGYPWNCGTSLNLAKFWDTQESAESYRKHFPDLKLFRFEYQLYAME